MSRSPVFRARTPRWIALAAVCAALLAPQTASAHGADGQWFGLNYPGQLTYVDVFRHNDFTMNVEATWDYVSSACGYLRTASRSGSTPPTR